MGYRNVKDRHQYFREAVFDIEEWVLQNPSSQFSGGFPAYGPKPPKLLFLVIGQMLREGVTEDKFMYGPQWRVSLEPYNKNWVTVDVVITIDLLDPEEYMDPDYEEKRARWFAEDTMRRYWNNE